ncbi:transferrin receptor protein 1 [Microcaecilia unicolor]|uniref:Transferrin receptor protein 1 n=1 Tax=Microcaecilia unicolor TaxID=1415580 RepID=A0A6P7Z931_9AMPH|nr:transferrin receptor protein 1 [Microcaecilia unicolor]XP_030071925.1 transferrin receptor protein 1 [Microcaecilia unicolor]
MDQARSAISNLFSGEPLSYTRFSLAQQVDGDNSNVEMKLADEEETGEDSIAENHVPHRTLKPRTRRQNLCVLVIAAVLLFLIGFLIGYLSYRGHSAGNEKCIKSETCDPLPTVSTFEMVDEPKAPSELYWSDLKPLLSKRLQGADFLENIRRVSRFAHEAGSQEDENLANDMYSQFSSFKLDKVWYDEHYVTLQKAGRLPNGVSIVGENNSTVEEIGASAYVAYSPNATVIGKPVYAYYGRKEDFQQLAKQNIDFSGSVVILRAGKNTFAEKVANADNVNAAGVLIYPHPSDYRETDVNVLYGHAHLGTGDPFTPGFPSFNHTQFPPSKSSGLPRIPVQTISTAAARRLLQLMEGAECPVPWRGFSSPCKLGPEFSNGNSVKLEVRNEMDTRKIHNIFGFIRGFVEPEHYVVIGAQRDAWGAGAAKSGVGSSMLLKLAQVLSDMVKKDGYKPKRSMVFASWSAGEFGAVGATEWLEGYLSTLHMKAFAYINLDAVVLGSDSFHVSGSPMLYKLIKATLKEVKNPQNSKQTLYDSTATNVDWTNTVPLSMDNAAYPFVAYSGIPAISFSFQKASYPYGYLNTDLDTFDNLQGKVKDLNIMCLAAAEVAAQMVIRLTYNRQLPLDYESYSTGLQNFVNELLEHKRAITSMGLDLQWIFSARGDFNRALTAIKNDIQQSDMTNIVMCHKMNARIMKVEHLFLSLYVSPKDTPFRHILYGLGNHTLTAMLDHLKLFKTDLFDEDIFKNQLALATWSIQGAANALAGDVWDIDNEF